MSQNQWSAVTRMQLNNTVERILHVRGNYTGGILEMTVVLDMGMDPAVRQQVLQNSAKTLKSHSPVFRNVRTNLVCWYSDTEIQNQVVPLIQLTMDSFYHLMENDVSDQIENAPQGSHTLSCSPKSDSIEENSEGETAAKKVAILMSYLKKFHARSKLILLVTDGTYLNPETDQEMKELEQSMEPFLGRKIARVLCREESVVVGYRNWIVPITPVSEVRPCQ